MTCAVRVQEEKEKRPLSPLCFFCRKGVQLEGQSKMDERKESAEDLDYCLLLLVER